MGQNIRVGIFDYSIPLDNVGDYITVIVEIDFERVPEEYGSEMLTDNLIAIKAENVEFYDDLSAQRFIVGLITVRDGNLNISINTEDSNYGVSSIFVGEANRTNGDAGFTH